MSTRYQDLKSGFFDNQVPEAASRERQCRSMAAREQ